MRDLFLSSQRTVRIPLIPRWFPALWISRCVANANWSFYFCQMKDDEARRAVVRLLSKGLITIPEATRLSGVSRQLVHHWARRINAKRVRAMILAKLWRKEVTR